jgi:hypothetical protein
MVKKHTTAPYPEPDESIAQMYLIQVNRLRLRVRSEFLGTRAEKCREVYTSHYLSAEKDELKFCMDTQPT